ncbi:MAG: hypothetical protein LBC92_00435 [Rickettsiales bacterium]|jgi:hypothetical protein|nr:hypothetical protein [Rickettsiales bacterium]
MKLTLYFFGCDMSDNGKKENLIDGKATGVADTSDEQEGASHSNKLGKFVVILVILFVSVFLIALIYLKATVNVTKIIKEINHDVAFALKDSKVDFKIDGQGEFSLFPLPHITTNNINLKNFHKNNYAYNFTAKNVKFFPSIIQLFLGKIIPTKIVVDGMSLNINEIEQNVDNADILNIFPFPNSIVFKTVNSKILINGLSYNRELDNISIDISKVDDKINVYGSLHSNKYPLSVSGFIEMIKSENSDHSDFISVIDIDSQAFNSNSKISGKTDLSSIKVISNTNVETLQIFIKTILNDNSFLYKRIKDNNVATISLSLDYKDDVLDIVDFSMSSKNMKGSLTGTINFEDDASSVLNIVINNINLDSLITEASPVYDKIDLKKIYIFNKDNYKFATNNSSIKTLNINFGASLVEVNDISIKDFILISSISNGIVSFDIFSFNINNGSSIFEVDTNNMISFSGDDFRIFSKDISKKIDKELPFLMSGKLSLDNYGKILFTDIKGNIDSIPIGGDVEIQYDGKGTIQFIAVNTIIDDLDLENALKYRKSNEVFKFSMLKSEVLFLNDYSTNAFYKFNIKNLKYKDWSDTNYNFSFALSNKYLSVYDVDLNDKIFGNLSIYIGNQVPKFDANIHIKDYEFKEKIDFIDLIFKMPSMDDFGGNLTFSVENVKYVDSNIGKLSLNAVLTDGNYNFKTFAMDSGFGGKCNLTSGFLDMKYNKKLNVSMECALNLKDTLYLFTNEKNVSGMLGIGAVLYAEGVKQDEFTKNFLVKMNFAGSVIQVDGFGMKKLSDDLFQVNYDRKLLDDVSHTPRIISILFKENNSTIFEEIAGNIQFSKKSGGGTVNISMKSQLYNGKLAGNFDLFQDYVSFKLNNTFIMLAGTLQSLIPLTISTNISGDTKNGLQYGANVQQIREYLSILQNGSSATNSSPQTPDQQPQQQETSPENPVNTNYKDF